VVALYTGEEALRLAEARQRLAAAGVALYLANARDPYARWLRRAASPRQR
jgi:hypothetical protein